MKINSNMQAAFAQTILAHNEEKMSKATQQMSSGYKINKAKDNPAGMAISNRMRSRLQSLDRANQNSKNAINTLQTADGGLAEIEEMLQRMNELAVQASNGLISDSDRKAIQEEVNQLTDEIERVSKNTTYNTQSLLDGSQALKGYVIDNPNYAFDGNAYKHHSVRNYNEDFPDGKYMCRVSYEFDGNDGFTTKLELWDDTDGTQTKMAIQSTEATVFYDNYDDPKEIMGSSIKVTLVGGGEITIDAKAYNPGGDDGLVIAGNGIKTVAFGDFWIETYSHGGMTIQTGADEGQEVQIVIPEVSKKTLNFIDLNGNRTLDMASEDSATRAITRIEKAIDYVSAARAKVGAYQNRIEKTVSNLDVTYENLTESYSTIKDLDMAEGMVEYTTLQVLIQAGNSMLAQANEQPQQALQLLQ